MSAVRFLRFVISPLVIFAALFVFVRGGTGEGVRVLGGAQPDYGAKFTRYSDLNGFLASDAGKASAQTQVVFIGIDGATWRFIDPLIERGLLPNLERIKKEGACGKLRSIPCYVSPPAWVSMLTGCLPEKSGVYSYGKWDRAQQEFVSVNAGDVEVPSVWDVASAGGKKVGGFNVPMTYPPQPINGVMVSGMMTPRTVTEPFTGYPGSLGEFGDRRFRGDVKSYSPVLKTAVNDSLNVYFWSLVDTVDDRVKDYDLAILAVASKVDNPEGKFRTRFYTFEVGEFSPWIQIQALNNGQCEDGWCKIAIAKTPDGRYDTQISPIFFEIDKPFTYPDTVAAHLYEKYGVYVPSAFVSSELVPEFTREAATQASHFYNLDDWDLYLYVFTQSDNIHHHAGFSTTAAEVYQTIDRFIGEIMDEMPVDGTLIIASDHGFRQYTYGVDLNLYFEELGLLRWRDRENIDYDETLVFHNIWHLYFNHDLITVDELEKRGINVPSGGNPVDVFVRYLQGAVKTVGAPDGEISVSLELRRLKAGADEDAPDMRVVAAYDEVLVDFLGFANPHSRVVRRLEGIERWWHERDGVFLAWGKGVRKGFQSGRKDIQDIAPTILYLLDLPVAADMDGHVIYDIFERGLLSSKGRFIVDDYSQIRKDSASRDVGREKLEKKLRSLGYMQ